MRERNHDTAMRTASRARVRAAAWWATIALVGVVMAAFMVFEVLDLDGSNLGRLTNGNTLTAGTPVLETEHLLSRKGDLSSKRSTERVFPFLAPPEDSVVARATIRPPTLRAYRQIVHLHAWKDDALCGAAPTPSDPA